MSVRFKKSYIVAIAIVFLVVSLAMVFGCSQLTTAEDEVLVHESINSATTLSAEGTSARYTIIEVSELHENVGFEDGFLKKNEHHFMPEGNFNQEMFYDFLSSYVGTMEVLLEDVHMPSTENLADALDKLGDKLGKVLEQSVYESKCQYHLE